MSDCKMPCNKYQERIERLEAENVYLKKLILSAIRPNEVDNKAARLKSNVSGSGLESVSPPPTLQ